MNYTPPGLTLGWCFMQITFDVQGEPKATPRAKASSINGFTRMYTPKTADGWKVLVRSAAMPHRPPQRHEGPVRMVVDLALDRPKRLLTRKSSPDAVPLAIKPDADNLVKAILDALTDDGGWWKDDCQVYDLHVRKFYRAIGAPPGARVTIHLENT